MKPIGLRIAASAYGLFAYALFGASLVHLVAFLSNANWLPVTVDRGPATPAWQAVLIDTLLLSMFGVQHSGMARRWFKRRWTRVVPANLERSTYVLVSSALLSSILLLWQPVPVLLWSVADTDALLLWAGLGIGLAVLLAASFHIDHLELLGLRQALAPAYAEPMTRPLVVRGFYRLVRHPIYTGWLLMFWSAPAMTAGHLLLAGGMTAYVLTAIVFEERDLVRDLGQPYAEYRRRVPALLPALLSNRGRAGDAIRIGILLVGLFAIAATVRAETAATETAREPLPEFGLDVDGRHRTAKLFVPAGNGPVRRIVLMLHGAHGNSERIRHFTGYGLERLAARERWLVAYPEGVGGTWNDCRSTPAYPAHAAEADDGAFLAELIDALRGKHGLAATDVLLAGFSNGGQMAMRFAAEYPRAVGGIAVIAAQLPTHGESRCEAEPPAINSLWFFGSHDPFLPAGGGTSVGPRGESLGDVLSIDATLRAFLEPWAHVEGPAVNSLPERDGNTATSVELAEWRDGRGLRLRRYLLNGSGHVVPQPHVALPAIAGTAAGDIDFAEAVSEFLRRVP